MRGCGPEPGRWLQGKSRGLMMPGAGPEGINSARAGPFITSAARWTTSPVLSWKGVEEQHPLPDRRAAAPRQPGSEPMDPLLAELIRLAYGAIGRADRWMREHVRGFHGFSVDERRSDANLLGFRLWSGTCGCGLAHCPD